MFSFVLSTNIRGNVNESVKRNSLLQLRYSSLKPSPFPTNNHNIDPLLSVSTSVPLSALDPESFRPSDRIAKPTINIISISEPIKLKSIKTLLHNRLQHHIRLYRLHLHTLPTCSCILYLTRTNHTAIALISCRSYFVRDNRDQVESTTPTTWSLHASPDRANSPITRADEKGEKLPTYLS